MPIDTHRLPRYFIGDVFVTPKPDNNNWHFLPDWMTPAEFTQWLNREKQKAIQEFAADFRLRACPKHRLDWDLLIAMERCAAFHLYGIRSQS